jgi:hypothetical protein
MPGVSANSADKPTTHRTGIEPMWRPLARGLIFLAALATPIIATLLAR